MRVDVYLFATLSDYLPPKDRRERKVVLELPEGSRVKDAISRLQIPAPEVHLLVVNGEQSLEEAPLSEGDVISLFPAIAGGVLPEGSGPFLTGKA